MQNEATESASSIGILSVDEKYKPGIGGAVAMAGFLHVYVVGNAST